MKTWVIVLIVILSFMVIMAIIRGYIIINAVKEMEKDEFSLRGGAMYRNEIPFTGIKDGKKYNLGLPL